MKIYFKIKTDDIPHINSAIFSINNVPVIIERYYTEYGSVDKNGYREMMWKQCHIYNGETDDFNISEKTFKDAIFIEFLMDDEASEDTNIDVVECFVEETPVAIHNKDAQ